jgi:hypothetical protein
MSRCGAGTCLTAAAIGSLVLAAFLVGAARGSFRVGYDSVDNPPTKVRSTSVSFRTGLVDIRSIIFRYSNVEDKGTRSSSISRFWWGLDKLAPEIKSEFHASYSPNQRPEIEIIFPVWSALLPCLIAPVLWWRRRRAVSPRGFEVQL